MLEWSLDAFGKDFFSKAFKVCHLLFLVLKQVMIRYDLYKLVLIDIKRKKQMVDMNNKETTTLIANAISVR
jgi:hypothetical protein